MLLLYRIGIKYYGFMVWIFSFFNEKARKFVNGRKKQFFDLRNDLKGQNPVWIHAASLGEFEQGRPIIAALKRERPNQKILLTFFSPSGYEIRKKYSEVDWVYYLPLDSPKNARRFISIINPKIAIFIKYEFWYYFLNELKKQDVPTLMVSAIFRDNQLFFHWSGRFFHKVFRSINHFFVQDEESHRLISRISSQVTIAGDTRFDRVIEIARNAKMIEKVDAFIAGKPVFVLGSTWISDLNIIGPFIRKNQENIKFIVAPHNIREDDLIEIEKTFEETVRFSSGETVEEKEILIIDNMGMLSSLYSYADYAFIGGAFRGALHNTLEAAVYGIPVFFGEHQNNKKFAEAIELVKIGGAFSFLTLEEFEKKFAELQLNNENYKVMSKAAGDFVKLNAGATELVMKKVIELI
jgi:3-deoxy-D-manno-octulosonic-acid transferase